MDKPPVTAPNDALAVYVCLSNPLRSVKYPFVEGTKIPRTIEKDGLTFALRSVHYEASGIDIVRAA